MSDKKGGGKHEEVLELRRGPWTLEEDTLLIHYIACNGEGRWNLLARCSGLKRTGKSCRLRWLNYLKPDVKRGNLSPEEQLLILELHSKWGNRWSRIAQHLPGRTDNEIKNYWRTRVQKQARQLKIDANSAVFRDVARCYWMPRLVERIASSQSIQSFYPNTAAALDEADPFAPPPQDSIISPSFQSSSQSSRCYDLSGSDNCSPSAPQLLKLSEFRHLDEPGETYYDPIISGHCIANAYDLDALDLASDSASAFGYLASNCAVVGNKCGGDNTDMADSLWSMVEGYMSQPNGDHDSY